MKIGDLIQLLDNRLREFKLSRDYARMSGDLERMNAADKEIIGLEDTLYQLNLLIDVSKSATVKENTLAGTLTDGSLAVLGEYDITIYATDPKHEEKVMNILSKMGIMDTVEKIDDYIKSKYWGSPVTGEMIMSAAEAYTVDTRLIMAIMEQDSRFGTAGVAVRTRNPGNVGNDDDGNTRTYDSWQEGVTAVAEWLSRHRGSTIMPKILEETILELIEPEGSSEPERPTATSTDPFITPTATSTPAITTSTTTTVTTIPVTATSTPITSPSTSSGQATTTPTIATSTPTTTTSSSTTTATTTPITATTTPITATSTPLELNEESSTSNEVGTATSTTTTTSTTIPVTATSTPTNNGSTTTSPSTDSGQATSTPVTVSSTPITTSTTSTPN